MPQLIKLLLSSVLCCLLAASSIAQKPARRTRKPSTPAVICKIASVPNGMVVGGYKRNSACSEGSELLVKQPETGDIICAESPLPPGFSIASEAQGVLVGTCPNKAFLISGATPAPATEGGTATLGGDDTIGRAFASGTSNIPVEGEGTVVRVLPDDLDGPRHQRFIVQLESGQTLLMAHNTDIAPRIDGLKPGDNVRFRGEYVWNAKGGVVHWTHHDPQGKHAEGWLVHNGKTFK